MPQTGERFVILIFRYAWILFVLIQCANGAVWWYRGRRKIAENPALEAGYRRLINGWVTYGNIPWLVMGAGIPFGGVPSVFHYLNPRNGPFVIMFWLSVVAVWILTFYWLFLRGGAEELISHPGLLNLPVQKPWIIKAYFLLTLTGGVAALVATLVMNIQVPTFR